VEIHSLSSIFLMLSFLDDLSGVFGCFFYKCFVIWLNIAIRTAFCEALGLLPLYSLDWIGLDWIMFLARSRRFTVNGGRYFKETHNQAALAVPDYPECVQCELPSYLPVEQGLTKTSRDAGTTPGHLVYTGCRTKWTV